MLKSEMHSLHPDLQESHTPLIKVLPSGHFVQKVGVP